MLFDDASRGWRHETCTFGRTWRHVGVSQVRPWAAGEKNLASVVAPFGDP
jgi:hypothetical protein